MIENFSAEEIGLRIQTKLKEMNLKQTDLKEITNLSKNAISNYVSGNRIPDTRSIYRIAKALSVSIEWLLTGEISTEMMIAKEDTDTYTLFKQLDNDNKTEVKGMIRILLNGQKRRIKETSSTSTLKDNAS